VRSTVALPVDGPIQVDRAAPASRTAVGSLKLKALTLRLAMINTFIFVSSLVDWSEDLKRSLNGLQPVLPLSPLNSRITANVQETHVHKDLLKL
jgi:hypothetical protein